MDARRLALLGGVWLLLAVSGCATLWPPTERPKTAPPAPGPTTVADEGAAEGANAAGSDEEQLILGWISKVEAAPLAGEQPLAEPVADPAPELAPPVQGRPPVVSGGPGDEERPAVDIGPADEPIVHIEPEVAAQPEDDPPAAAPPPSDPNETAGGDEPLLAPPVLAKVDVLTSGGGAALDVLPAETDGQTTANGGEVATTPPASLAELVEKYFAEPQDDSFRAQLDVRIARVLAGDYEGARQPLSLVTNEQQQLAGGFIEALIAIRQNSMGNPTDGASEALQRIEQLLPTLSAASELQIPRFTLCRRVVAYGNYVPIDPPDFPAGAPIAFATYCETRNLVSEQREDGNYHAELAMTTTILTHDGDTVHQINDNHITDTCRNRRLDFFLAREVHLPPLSPGTYVAKVTIKDKLGQKVAESRTTFRVTLAQAD